MTESRPAEALLLEEVRKKMETFSLEASFEVRPGERVAIFGPSGCGKTTLLRLISGLERLDGPEDRGRILLGSELITGLRPEQRGIGVVFQEQALFPALNVIENAAFALRMQGRSRQECESAALPWLRRVGMEALARSPVTHLSGGERQRLAFVRAVLWKPRALLLDEPFSALDSALRAQLRTELLELHSLWPVPLLLVTHDEADVAAIATRRISCVQDPKSSTRRFTQASS